MNNLTIPIQLSPDEQFPNVFVIDYLCPAFQFKSAGALILSVFSGTFAMYATVYAIFIWLTAELDNECEEREKQAKDEESIPLTTQHRESLDSSADHEAEASSGRPGHPNARSATV